MKLNLAGLTAVGVLTLAIGGGVVGGMMSSGHGTTPPAVSAPVSVHQVAEDVPTTAPTEEPTAAPTTRPTTSQPGGSSAVDTSGTPAHHGTVSTPENDPAPAPSSAPSTDPAPQPTVPGQQSTVGPLTPAPVDAPVSKPHVCTDGEVRHFPAGSRPSAPSSQTCHDNTWGPEVPDDTPAPPPVRDPAPADPKS